MCGILGIFDGDADMRAALQAMQARGRDAVGVADHEQVRHGKRADDLSFPNSKPLLAHLLHAVVGHVPQPLRREGTLVYNGEIYNWKRLAEEHAIESANDTQLLLGLLDKKGVLGTIPLLDGVFAFIYEQKDAIWLARDVLGVKPLWVAGTRAAASQRNALIAAGYQEVRELNPRTILEIRGGKAREHRRDLLGADQRPPSEEELDTLLESAVKKRLPDVPLGILFSGGVDSALLARLCKRLGRTPRLYAVGTEGSADLRGAQSAAAEFGLPLTVITLDEERIEALLKEVVPLVGDASVVKAGVAVAFRAACERAREDGIKVLFSGLGSEELFAGYQRHGRAFDVNKECRFGLRRLYERDLCRDDIVAMASGIELRLPFLDHALAGAALAIPGEEKIAEGMGKMPLRKAAVRLGVPETIAMRPKKAAQYGSGIDKMLGRVAKRERTTKSGHLARVLGRPTMRIAALWSGGKDSAYAAWTMKRMNYGIACLVTVHSKNPSSYMFHTPAIELAPLQARAMDVPIIVEESEGKKEAELVDLERALRKAQDEHDVEGIVSGALFSTYQRERIEGIADRLGLKIFAPLWHLDQEEEMRGLLRAGFEVVLTAVAAEGLDSSWLGRPITGEDVDRLVALQRKLGVNVAGEGGEFESFVVAGPLFEGKIRLEKTRIEDDGASARLVVEKAQLIPG